MNFSENIKDLGLLSELAYLKLEDSYFNDGVYSLDNIDSFFKSKVNTDNEYNGTGVDNSTTSMLSILKKYDIKHFKSFSSDLQLMVLEDKNNPGNYIVSFRGTEFNLFSADITSDFEMALGKETDQMKDALAYVIKLQNYGYTSEDKSIIIPPLTKTNSTITGHSLGGALAQYIGYETGFETYTFNGFGMKKNELASGKPFSVEKDTSNIHNFYLGVDPVSTFASEIGGYAGGVVYEKIKKTMGYLPDSVLNQLQKALVNTVGLISAATINSILNEHYSKTFLGEMIHIIPSDGHGFWDNINDHYMSGFNESLALYSYLEEVFNTSDIESLNSYINELARTNFEDINSSINVYNNINTNGMPKAIELIHNALVGVYPRKNVNYDDISTIHDSLDQIISIVEDNGGIFYYSYFADSEALLSSAKESKGLMYTLINNLPPIIVNNSNYELYEDLDISYMSEEQLNDKALMYYYLINNEKTTIGEKIDFLDYSNNVTTSSTLTNDININTQKVIFGSNDETKEETLVGTYNDDRIYGNAGNDKIIGNNGDNYLEGGDGNDYLEGGIKKIGVRS